MKKWDVIVVGGGHAGIEACWAAARMGARVLLLSLNIDDIGKLSCNPAIGGVAKGTLVKEVDALGGLMARITDRSVLGRRRLNKSKGKAVWASRAQVDMTGYTELARGFLSDNKNIELFQAKVNELVVRNRTVIGVKTNFGEIFRGRTIIVCGGTFLNSRLHIGLDSFPGGRLGELSCDELFQNIKDLGFKTTHFKTGTCARLDRRTIDFSQMAEQPPEYDVEPFSFSGARQRRKQLSCFITYTNKRTHGIILRNLDRSPLYTGRIKSVGVRYCPSLEDKVVRFSDKDRHQIFIEPEGIDSVEVYPNGISTSLPFDVQDKFIRTIPGLKNTVILRPGYGIEHGVVFPTQLYPSLETRIIKNLWFAGQVNGTTGYEEAAAQGVIAGINAVLKIKGKRPFVLGRHQALIGVMIDDLTSKGVDEPYRMFTSRAEYRLILRESNADLRLTPLAYELGLAGREDYERVKEKKAKIKESLSVLRNTRIKQKGVSRSFYDVVKQPGIKLDSMERKHRIMNIRDRLIIREVEISIKYEGFIKREESQLRLLQNMDRIKIPPDIDFKTIPSLSREIVEKLNKLRPATLSQALSLSGITPAAVIAVFNFLNSRKRC